MKTFILLFILLTNGCYQEIEVQINPYACIDDFKWNLQGFPIVNEYGAQEACI
jgi:hypothetical protein